MSLFKQLHIALFILSVAISSHVIAESEVSSDNTENMPSAETTEIATSAEADLEAVPVEARTDSEIKSEETVLAEDVQDTIVEQEASAEQDSIVNQDAVVDEDAVAEQVETETDLQVAVSEQTETAEEVTPQLEEDEASALSVEELKKKVINLNRDLFILEEDLLFPANTQFVSFLSINTGNFLDLDVVKLKVDDEIVASHLYTERQLTALSRGGIQRLYVGNLKTGEHEVTVFVEGMGPDDRIYKKAASAVINKDTDVKAIEIRIEDKSSDFQPHISINEW